MRLLTVVLVVTCLWSAALHADTVRSAKVRIVRLEDVPQDLCDQRFAVRVFIGSKRLYQTPWARGPKLQWNKSLRAYTAAKNPLFFEVVTEHSAPPKSTPSPPHRSISGSDQDRTLAKGFEELVGDWEDDPSPPPARVAVKSPAPKHSVLCRTRLSWPPSEGEHRLECGAMSLVVYTTNRAQNR